MFKPLAVAVATVALAVFPATSADAHRAPRHLPACQFEDGPGPCYWDAKTRGNGEGRSYWIDRRGGIHYVHTHKHHHRHHHHKH